MIPRTRLGVMGWPVGHSRSPAMQNAALGEAGLDDWRYSLLPVPAELFTETVRALPARGFRGVNVTIPHKEAALEAADRAGAAARAIGAANTLLFEDGIRAENTDAPGLIAALPVRMAGASALVLGAGGSARAAVWALLDAGASDVRVWNRTPERARRLTAQLGGTPLRSGAVVPREGDVLVNCTSVGMGADGQQFKRLPLAADAVPYLRCVVDFVYRSKPTPLISAARRHGIPAVDGLELLVQQGALSYTLFTGHPAPIEVMRTAARGDDLEVMS